jgi:cation transport protein ChaC
MACPEGRSPDLWVFGYGSLMWRPGFAFDAVFKGRVTGYRRAFCIASAVHRGTPARPGLVLGLDRGGSCEGIVYRIPPDRVTNTLVYLRQREQVNGVYREAHVSVEILGRHDDAVPADENDPATVLAITYIVERAHPSYVGMLSLGQQARLIRGATGVSGANLDYLINTVEHLHALGFRDRALERLAVRAAYHVGNVQRGPARPAARALQRHVVRQGLDGVVALPKLRRDQRRRFLYRLHLGELAKSGPGRHTAPRSSLR